MELAVRGSGPPTPFLRAKDRFETAYDLDRPVTVNIREEAAERTCVSHHDDRHVLNISSRTAKSAMATQLALHEYAHMRRHEEGHPSHVQPTAEVLFVGLPGRSLERATLTHCYQIANHVKDIYADDITLSVGPADRLAAFLESELAAAVAAQSPPVGTDRRALNTDPSITAVNASFAIGLLERHDVISKTHSIYDLAHAAAEDALTVDVSAFIDRFRSLSRNPTESEYRRILLELVHAYVEARPAESVAVD